MEKYRMAQQHLLISNPLPPLRDATLLLALTGWMDGGLVSTGTVQRIMDDRKVVEAARIEAEPFYLYNFPGSMDVAAMFRPQIKIVDGLIDGELGMPTNIFHVDSSANLVFFLGREPNMLWQTFADCIFEMASQLGVKRIIFMGSFGGTVPHTREPRMYGSVSHEHLRPVLARHGLRLSNYEGPAGFSSLLVAQSPARGIEMISLVAEIPGYLEGLNPRSIEAVTRRLAALLGQPADLEAMRKASDEWELHVTEAVEKDSELAETVHKLEEQYDNELIGGAESNP
jgi:proteasome assembly chaperone (PAC2) family protein